MHFDGYFTDDGVVWCHIRGGCTFTLDYDAASFDDLEPRWEAT